MTRGNPPSNRRRWLLGALAVGALGAADAPADPRLAAIRTRARKAEMQGFDETESAHFVAIGDAKRQFREEALAVCEAVGAEYFKMFAAKGFAPSWPKRKLVVVVLLGPKSYAQFNGVFPDESDGGHFDLEADHLVIFNFRGPGANPKAPIAEQDNTLTLVHEAMHQLTFDTGLLDLKADVPKLIGEGLATFGETWGPRRRGKIGDKNQRRLLGLRQAREAGGRWIPLATLLADDTLFDAPETAQVAYAEGWLLAYELLRDSARLPKFRDYLAALRQQPNPSRRLATFQDHLGDLAKLDNELRTGR